MVGKGQLCNRFSLPVHASFGVRAFAASVRFAVAARIAAFRQYVAGAAILMVVRRANEGSVITKPDLYWARTFPLLYNRTRRVVRPKIIIHELS